MNLNQLQERNSSKKGSGPSVTGVVTETVDSIIVTIPKTIGLGAVKQSATEKAVPMVTVVPRKANGEAGVPYVTVHVQDGDNRASLSGRIGTFNLFL